MPRARGEAAQKIQQAEAYREQAVAEATGQAARFTQVYDEYRKAPAVIRERIFLETMERVLGGMDKIIIDQSGQGAGRRALSAAERDAAAAADRRPAPQARERAR